MSDLERVGSQVLENAKQIAKDIFQKVRDNVASGPPYFDANGLGKTPFDLPQFFSQVATEKPGTLGLNYDQEKLTKSEKKNKRKQKEKEEEENKREQKEKEEEDELRKKFSDINLEKTTTETFRPPDETPELVEKSDVTGVPDLVTGTITELPEVKLGE